MGPESSYHSSFVDANMDAITVQAQCYGSNRAQAHRDSISKLLAFTSSVWRPLNNLHEKLHHSTFLYLLVSNTHFVTLEKYFYSFVLIGLPLPLMAFYLFYFAPTSKFLTSFVLLGSTFSLALVVYSAPRLIEAYLRVTWTEHPELQQAWTLVSSGLILGLTILARIGSKEWDWRALKAMGLMGVFLGFAPIGVLNFPVGVSVLLPVTPLLITAQPYTSQGYKLALLLRWGLLVLLSPPVLGIGIAYLLGREQTWRNLLTIMGQRMANPENLIIPCIMLMYLPCYVLCILLNTAKASVDSNTYVVESDATSSDEITSNKKKLE